MGREANVPYKSQRYMFCSLLETEGLLIVAQDQTLIIMSSYHHRITNKDNNPTCMSWVCNR